MLTEAEVTGRSAFARLFTEQTSAVTVALPGGDEPAPLEEALSRLQDPDRERRAQAAESVTVALQPGLRTRAFIFNTLLADKATKDRLRSYPHWLASRNLANEAGDESVQALIDAVVGHYELARRSRSGSWSRLRASSSGTGSSASGRSAVTAEVCSVNRRAKAERPVTSASVSTRSSGSESWWGR